jgi:hypothetical protein
MYTSVSLNSSEDQAAINKYLSLEVSMLMHGGIK